MAPCKTPGFPRISIMYDPLGSTASAFGGQDYHEAPPWPTTPHPPGSPIPNLRRASPAPPLPDKGPTPGLYGKEPQIYGQPEAGLVSPETTKGSNGVRYERGEPYLRVRINGLDRNRRDILVKFDAQVMRINIVVFNKPLNISRRISPTSTEQHTEIFHVHTSNSSNSTSRLF